MKRLLDLLSRYRSIVTVFAFTIFVMTIVCSLVGPIFMMPYPVLLIALVIVSAIPVDERGKTPDPEIIALGDNHQTEIAPGANG